LYTSKKGKSADKEEVWCRFTTGGLGAGEEKTGDSTLFYFYPEQVQSG